jgi:hypothetical protein
VFTFEGLIKKGLDGISVRSEDIRDFVASAMKRWADLGLINSHPL